jgi:hypothetical protein
MLLALYKRPRGCVLARRLWNFWMYQQYLRSWLGEWCTCTANVLADVIRPGLTPAAVAFLQQKLAAVDGLIPRLSPTFVSTQADARFMKQSSFSGDEERCDRMNNMLSPYGVRVEVRRDA